MMMMMMMMMMMVMNVVFSRHPRKKMKETTGNVRPAVTPDNVLYSLVTQEGFYIKRKRKHFEKKKSSILRL